MSPFNKESKKLSKELVIEAFFTVNFMELVIGSIFYNCTFSIEINSDESFQ